MIDLTDYDLILFDFDGLLVDTEFLHFKAYEEVVKSFGIAPFWDYLTYCRYAHLGTHGEAIYRDFPDLLACEPEWEGLRQKKMVHYQEILKTRSIDLMPGAAKLLERLIELNKRLCVVTNSKRDDVMMIRTKIPLLNLVPNWLTRDDYEESKPSPVGYRKALSLYGVEEGKSIGFEDTIKGLTALHLAGIDPVLVCDKNHPQLESAPSFPFRHIESLGSCLNNSNE